MNETKPPQPTPEQLLQMLDLQIKCAREMRGAKVSDKNHTISLVVICFIIVIGMAALWLMISFLESMRPARNQTAPSATEIR